MILLRQVDGSGHSPICPTMVCTPVFDSTLRCFTKSSEAWRLRRQAFHDALPPSNMSRLESEMMHNTVEMLAKIIEKPEQTFIHFFECGPVYQNYWCQATKSCGRASGDLMMRIVYGVPHLPQGASHFEALSAVHHIMVWQTSRKWDLMCLFLKFDCKCYNVTSIRARPLKKLSSQASRVVGTLQANHSSLQWTSTQHGERSLQRIEANNRN